MLSVYFNTFTLQPLLISKNILKLHYPNIEVLQLRCVNVINGNLYTTVLFTDLLLQKKVADIRAVVKKILPSYSVIAMTPVSLFTPNYKHNKTLPSCSHVTNLKCYHDLKYVVLL